MATELIVDDGTSYQNPDLHAGFRGLVPRDLVMNPVGYAATIPPASIKLIPRSEWSDLIKQGEASKSFLSHLRDRGNAGAQIPSLSQNGQGFCWQYAPVIGLTLGRAKSNLPYVRLSAHAAACKSTGFKDVGGWGAKGVENLLAFGCPSVATWKEQSMNRQYDTAATWAEAALYKPNNVLMDLASPVYNRDLTFDQVMTCLLERIPVIGDFNWWGHAICLVDPVEVSPGQFGVRVWNSWGDSWSNKGMGVLTGAKAVPDNAVAIADAIA